MTLKGVGIGPVWLKLRDEEGRGELWGQRGQRGQNKYGPQSLCKMFYIPREDGFTLKLRKDIVICVSITLMQFGE